MRCTGDGVDGGGSDGGGSDGGGSDGGGSDGGGSDGSEVAVPLTPSVQLPVPPRYGYTVTVCVPALSVPLQESSLVPQRFVQ
ncbi:MAG: hypothetical protein F4156_16415 [Holophagales bacterium]|nr:hypothetical protein [Holophagales bacterium]